jgi:LmbE family N-acetylglucosaminyl deacetylase
METWFLPNTPCELPAARRVLVLAPHPDDEVFGCGGCIARYAEAGADVRVLVLSDGGGYLDGAERDERVRTRRAESRRAASLLGITDIRFGPWHDRTLAAAADLRGWLRDAMQDFDAALVFCPSLWEVHPDHRATALAALQAQQDLARTAEPGPGLAFYEVSAPLQPNCLVDITGVLARKRAAMAAFESELARQRYDRHIDALNLYRTYSLPPDVESAEALTLVAPTAAPAWLAGYNESAPPGIVRLTEGALARATTWGETLREANRDLEHAVQSLSVALDHERAERIALRDAIASLRDARDSERAFLHGQLDAVRAECEQHRQSLLEQIRAREAALEAVLSSRAWRITAPLRSGADWLKRRLGDGAGQRRG